MSPPLRHASIDWSQGTPYARDFADVYFSRAGGSAETSHVFLQQNGLQERFAAQRAGANFTIVETGFGTGLNWLATMALWQESRAEGWLHFVSVEKFPLTPADLERSHACWPHHAELSARLRNAYPMLLSGFHRRIFPEQRATLTLFLGDVADFMSRLAGFADAWFLDGFAPERNPEMWNAALYNGMAAHSRPGATFATFTAAGHVRRGLTAAGFHAEKTPGFGLKREMLRGQFESAKAGATASPTKSAPRHQSAGSPWLQRPAAKQADRHACIIGAGIAGASTAHRLALRGWKVTVLERDEPASGASGNPAAVIYPQLATRPGANDHFPQQAWLQALHDFSNLPRRDSPWHPCGILQLQAGNQAERARQLAAAQWPGELLQPLQAAHAATLARIPLHHDALWYPKGGWLEAGKYCRQLLDTPGITLLRQSPVQRIAQGQDGWRLYGPELLLECPVVIVANANSALDFNQLQQLPLQPVRGQISLAAASPRTAELATIVCHDGYLTPVLPDQGHCLGATYHASDRDVSVRHEDHAGNLQSLQRFLPETARSLEPADAWRGRASLRCQSPDYLPLVGPVADYAAFMQCYEGMQDGKLMPYPDLPVLPGLYVNLAHGSKGFSQAGLAAEILAAELNDEPYPVSMKVLDALHPMRFWIRQLKRQK